MRKISPPTGIRSSDGPARRQSLYRLCYRGPWDLNSFDLIQGVYIVWKFVALATFLQDTFILRAVVCMVMWKQRPRHAHCSATQKETEKRRTLTMNHGLVLYSVRCGVPQSSSFVLVNQQSSWGVAVTAAALPITNSGATWLEIFITRIFSTNVPV